MKTPDAIKQQGFLLIECLIYVALVTILLGITFALFYRCSDRSIGLRRSAEDITATLQAGEHWRADARNADGPIATVILEGLTEWRIPGAKGGVVYRLDGEILWRIASTNPAPRMILQRVAHSEMGHEDRHGIRCAIWEVALKPRRKGPRIHPVFHFLAVPNPEEMP